MLKRKILLGMGILSSISLPIISTISCGDTMKDPEMISADKSLTVMKKLVTNLDSDTITEEDKNEVDSNIDSVVYTFITELTKALDLQAVSDAIKDTSIVVSSGIGNRKDALAEITEAEVYDYYDDLSQATKDSWNEFAEEISVSLAKYIETLYSKFVKSIAVVINNFLSKQLYPLLDKENTSSTFKVENGSDIKEFKEFLDFVGSFLNMPIEMIMEFTKTNFDALALYVPNDAYESPLWPTDLRKLPDDFTKLNNDINSKISSSLDKDIENGDNSITDILKLLENISKNIEQDSADSSITRYKITFSNSAKELINSLKPMFGLS